MRIRAARPDDVPRVLEMIVELARYERAEEHVVATTELLSAALFGSSPSAEVAIAELDGETIGFALFFGTFSTWLGLPGLWLEDLYVVPEHRRAGAGRALLAHLAALALARGCGRLEWSALRWNEPALRFYDTLPSERLEEWVTLRLDGAALAELAGR